FARIAAALGPVDILVNNAGGNALGRLEEMDPALWWRLIEVNIGGPYACCRAALPSMLERRSGRIVNVSSINGKQVAKFSSAYCAAKHCVIGLTRALALDVASAGITATAVCPGDVRTTLTEAPF